MRRTVAPVGSSLTTSSITSRSYKRLTRTFTIREKVHTRSLALFKATRFAILMVLRVLNVLMVQDVRGGVFDVRRKIGCAGAE
jgi:hypothetical protein